MVQCWHLADASSIPGLSNYLLSLVFLEVTEVMDFGYDADSMPVLETTLFLTTFLLA